MRKHPVTNKPQVFIVSPDPHLGLTLQVVLREQGFEARCESDITDATEPFEPRALVTVDDHAVLVARRDVAEVLQLQPPIDSDELLRFLRNL